MCFEILFFTLPNSFYLGSHSFKKNYIDKMWLFNLCGKDCGLSLNHDFLFGFLSFNPLWFVAFAKAKFITLFLPSFFRKFFLHAKKNVSLFSLPDFCIIKFLFHSKYYEKKGFFLYQISVTFVVKIWPGNKFLLIVLFLWALKFTTVIQWSTITYEFAENLQQIL